MDYKYVVIGGGPAGVIAAETLAKEVPDQVLLIGGEKEPPYSRMAIPYYLVGNIKEEGTYLRKSQGHYKGLGISYQQAEVIGIDPKNKKLKLKDGNSIGYGKLCIATGSHAVKPPIEGLNHPLVHHCWTLEDARQIAKLAKAGANVVLMGAGFIGCIILEALASRKVHLSVIEMGDRMVPRMLDAVCGGLLKEWCEQEGVHVHVSTRITKVQEAGKALNITLNTGEVIPADLLVVAAGVAPNIAFLKDSGIAIGNGIRVDSHMETNIKDIYAAGDVAEAIDFSTHEWNVHAIQPVAADHGRIAALNMLGKVTSYQGSLGMNVLDTLGLISTSFGKWDGIKGGDHSERLDAGSFRYTRLEFDQDVLIGAQTLGRTEHVGVIRGLIQNRTKLGPWKERLMQDPNLLMDAYIDITHV